MKKLILPIVIGAVMFAAAFGGAFYLFRYWQGYAGQKAEAAAEDGLRALQEQGRTAVFSARLMAVLAVQKDGATDGASAGEGAASSAPQFVIIPGTVRYDLDLRGAKSTDISWDKEAATLKVKVPSLILDEPVFDKGGIRRYRDGRWTIPADPSTTLESARKQALGQLLEQARDEAPMTMARDAARKLVERAFNTYLKEDGVKAQVMVRFADEKSEDHGGSDHAAGQEE